MHPVSRLQWSIPGVGPLQPCLDRVEIVSSASVGKLKNLLPIAALELACHRLELRTYRGPDPRLRSRVIIVGLHSANPWPILARHEADLGRYSVTRAEIALDVEAASIEAARDGLVTLIGQLGKRRHQRGHIFSVHKPADTPPAGCVAEPTFYLEGRKGSVGLKCYVRHQKQPRGGFGGLCVRLEWTLTGKPALTRHLGGNRINHLATADLSAFLKRNLRLERVDHVALGNLLFPPRRIPPNAPAPWNDPAYRARRAAFLALRLLADREADKFGHPTTAWRTCRDSPAQIRDYLRELRDRQRRGKRGRRGRPKGKSRYRPITDFRPITDYRIDACFHPIELVPVAPAGITMSAQSKSLPTNCPQLQVIQNNRAKPNPHPMTHTPDEPNADTREMGMPRPDLPDEPETRCKPSNGDSHAPPLELGTDKPQQKTKQASLRQARLTRVAPSIARRRHESNALLLWEGESEFDEAQSKCRHGRTNRTDDTGATITSNIPAGTRCDD